MLHQWKTLKCCFNLKITIAQRFEAQRSLQKSTNKCETERGSGGGRERDLFGAGGERQRTYGGIWTFGGSGGSSGWFGGDVGAFGR